MADTLKRFYGDLEDLGSADKYIDEILEIIHHINLFDDFSENEIRAVCHYMRCFAAPRHYALLEEGKTGDYLLLVLTGAVEARKQSIDAGVETIAEIAVGSTLGEMSMVDGKPHMSSCIVTAPMDFAVLTRDALHNILLQSPRLGNKLLLTLLHLMSTRLRDASSRFLPSIA